MEKSSSTSSLSSLSLSNEVQCVGRLEISPSPKPVGFLCGSIPVPTDTSFHHHAFNSSSSSSAIVIPSSSSSSQKLPAPRYKILPTETDLNLPPRVFNNNNNANTSGSPWESDSITSNFTRKCESLAVSGLVEFGDQIDVIAPADILKQIFKMPYSKARLSVAVHRIGKTLILNKGPDIEEGEKLFPRHQSQSKCLDESLTLNFAMHSVRVEACDCPPNHDDPEREKSFVLPELFEPSGSPPVKCSDYTAQERTRVSTHNSDGNHHAVDPHSAYPQNKKDNYLLRSRKGNKKKGHIEVQNASQVGENLRCPIQESEKNRRFNDGFLRALFWQFHNFRMLLGSDLLLFSNEKYVSVSLNLWDVTREVTSLTWLEAWLDNVMASVPEVAICYHKNGVVQGYELLKTNDILLLKGISDDGTPAFHPDVVQQNGLSVLRFLQENCDQDPGAYWLYKNIGEDVIQLFDLSVISKNNTSDDVNDSSSSLPALIHRGRSESIFSLGTLLYRVAHRLSLSMDPNNRAKCVELFEKCLDFLDEPDHMVLRALAHEQFARLILGSSEDCDFTFVSLPLESTTTVTEADEDSLDVVSNDCHSIVHENIVSLVAEDRLSYDKKVSEESLAEDSLLEVSSKLTSKSNVCDSEKLMGPGYSEMTNPEENYESLAMCKMSPPSAGCVDETVTDPRPISSKLAAIHHVSQAIKALRVTHQLQKIEPEMKEHGNRARDRMSAPSNVSICSCGDTDCIEVCDIREWLPKSKLDHKTWKLVLLLGESYLGLGQAYKDDYQLYQALKVIELACSVYGSMPQHLKDTRFISSMACSSPSPETCVYKTNYNSYSGDACNMTSSLSDEELSLTYPFWAKAWTLIGDVYAEYHIKNGQKVAMGTDGKCCVRNVRMPPEVVKEVKRLKKRLKLDKDNCSSCSLVNCSCQSDRASSGSSASSSRGDAHSSPYARKTKKLHVKKHANDDNDSSRELQKGYENEHGTTNRNNDSHKGISNSESAESSPKRCGAPDFGQSETTMKKKGGIFKFLEDPVFEDADINLNSVISCYEEARKALGGFPCDSTQVWSTVKKLGWANNELGRIRLERKEMKKAEKAFADAINAFKKVADHTNIILINCNLGHGRRALAEGMLSNMENLKNHAMFQNTYNQALESVKVEYREALRFYGAARSELSSIQEEECFVSLRNEVHTQLAHTYLRLGMVLAREAVDADITLKDVSVGNVGRRTKKDIKKQDISANDAIREALSIYESLGSIRQQEAAYAYFQLACHQRDTSLMLLDPDHQDKHHQDKHLSTGETVTLQRARQYSSLAERNWQKAIDYYGPKTHPTMYLTILIERAELLSVLSIALHSNALLESALSCLLEGQHVDCAYENPQVCAKFWYQLQILLKNMLAAAMSTSRTKSSVSTPQTMPSTNKKVDAGKIKELYKMSLKATDLNCLKAMFSLWTS